MNKQITVLYFAQIAEQLGIRQESWDWPENANVNQWLQNLYQRHPVTATIRGRLKVAVNQQYANAHTLIQAGDEVAVFEPVTGG